MLTWRQLAASNGSSFHPPHRSRSRRPAIRAIRSNSGGGGQTQADRVEGDAVGFDADVGLVEDLRERVITADVEPDVVDADTVDVDELVAGP
jgi:hypothetical protein